MKRSLVALALAFSLAGCVLPAPTTTTTDAEPSASSQAPTTTEDGPTEEPTTEAPARYKPHRADWKIAIKIKKKQCFGSAGCNVTFRINPNYVGDQQLPDSGTIEVTYVVKGDESGPITNSFTVEDGSASYDGEEFASTPRAATKLTAKVTEVSYTD